MIIEKKEGYRELNLKCPQCRKRSTVHKKINTDSYGNLTESIDYRYCLTCGHEWQKYFNTYSI